MLQIEKQQHANSLHYFRDFGGTRTGVTAMPPSGGGLVESFLFSLDAVFDEVIPLAV